MPGSQTKILFGTDGIRGPAGKYPLDRKTVTRVGLAVAHTLKPKNRDATVVVGGDTRLSTPEIATWLIAGLQAGGVEVEWVGVIPTPGVAFLVRELEAAGGVAISASHNPYSDNGIKLLNRVGQKWSAAQERDIENLLAESLDNPELPTRPLRDSPDLLDRYVESLEASLPRPKPLCDLRICLDLANGAASPFAAALFRKLGAEVHTIFDQPNGLNINAGCGSTAPSALSVATKKLGCNLGVAFDGDADRAVLVDELGTVWDGDAILMLWALALQRDDKLKPPKVVATTMSNLGLQAILAENDIELIRCEVGDRQVVETMQREGIILGGEQSGHIIRSEDVTTGDGLLTALQMAYEVKTSSDSLSVLLGRFPHYPQVLHNVRVRTKPDFSSIPALRIAVEDTERILGDRGRLVLRYSGTEPLARVMIEGPDKAEIEELVEQLASAIQAEIGE